MTEQLLIDQLDQALDAIIARGDATLIDITTIDPVVADLALVAGELLSLPEANFKAQLKEELRRESMTSKAQPARKRKPAKRAPVRSITPYLTVERIEELIEFVKHTFGAVEVFRTIGSAGGLHAEVTIGDSRLMMGGYPGVEEMPTALHLYVPDADAVYRLAIEAGATSMEEPVDQFYGDRESGVKDPTGNVWWIATHKFGPAGTYVPEGMRTITPFLHPIGAAKLIDFMKDAFDAAEVSREQSPDGMIHHATVRIGDSLIEMGEAHGEAQPMPPALYMYVEDVEASYQRALAAGATSLQVPTEQGYGDRTAWVKDAWGNIWYLASPGGSRR